MLILRILFGILIIFSFAVLACESPDVETGNDDESNGLEETPEPVDDSSDDLKIYDDFSGTELDTKKWEVTGGAFQVDAGVLMLEGSGSTNLVSTKTFKDNFEVVVNVDYFEREHLNSDGVGLNIFNFSLVADSGERIGFSLSDDGFIRFRQYDSSENKLGRQDIRLYEQDVEALKGAFSIKMKVSGSEIIPDFIYGGGHETVYQSMRLDSAFRNKAFSVRLMSYSNADPRNTIRISAVEAK